MSTSAFPRARTYSYTTSTLKAWCRQQPDRRAERVVGFQAFRVKDWVGAAANLMPMSRESNLKWRSANPGAILHQEGLTYASHGNAAFGSLHHRRGI